MATLQNIRSKGPLLVIVIGLALFAFIAGDAWKVLQPHQSQDVGEVNGETISAQDFQALVEEYTEVIKFSSGNSALSDEQTNRIKDEVWRTYVNNKLIEKEAKKLGLSVSKAEVQAIIDAGVHPMLQQTPFRNPQTGAFDKDMLKKFLVDYSKMNKAQMPSNYAEYYESMYKFWSFLEKSLIQARLQEKYQALITKSLFSNPVEAQDAFDARVDQSDLLLAAVPYSSIVDSTIVIKDSDLKAAYDKKKEQFKQYVETRNIKFIDVQVTASAEDRAALQKEMEEYTEQLIANPSDYTTFIRSTGSETPYTDLFYTTKSLPADVTARLDSVAVGGVFGPYYNVSDNTLNSFKKLATAAMPDSIEFRQIQVVAEDAEKTKTLADSIYNAIKEGASFAEVAKKYGQTGEPTWISSANYEGAQIDGDNLKYITAVTTLGQNELTNLALGQANVILQVTNKKAVKDKYKVAVIKRPVEFSKETYSKAYNEFSQFIAANNTLEKMIANAEDAGYKLLDRADLYSSEHGIGGIRGTKDALKWAFEAKAGEVSGLYECGESDHMLVVGVASIVPEGYRPLALVKDQLRAEILRDKKAEKIMADMKAANATSFEQYKNMANAVSDSVKHVTFSAPAYIPALRSSEPLVGAYASIAEVNELTNLALGQANVILQVTNKKAVKDKYKVAVIKRPVEFSKETYSKAYNEFSQFIAANNTLEKMIANAEDAGYKLLDRADLYSSEHGIGGIRGTKDALKWAFEAKAGEVSGLYECGESDHMLVVGVASIVPEGYRPLALVKDQLRAEILRDKKAEKIMADMKAANATSFEQYKNMANAVSDSVKHVTFSAPAYIPALRSSEPLVGAYASIAEVNKLSAPIKGNGGVFVLQPYAKEKLNETFNKETEEDNLANMHARMASQFISDLYLKANVKDQRYLFF